MFEVIDYGFSPKTPDRYANTIGTYSDLESAKEHANRITEGYMKSSIEVGHLIMILDKEAHEVVFKTDPIYPT